jgi:hypothetical protein
MGNTKNFAFYACSFAGAQYGIDWGQNSGTMVVDSCWFANHGNPSWGNGNASCIRLGGGGNAVIRGCEVECYPDMVAISGGCRFVTGGGFVGSTALIETCFVSITMPADNIILDYTGGLTLIGNALLGGYGSGSANQNPVRILVGLGSPDGIGRTSVNYGPFSSLGNSYFGWSPGAYAPIVSDMLGPRQAIVGPGSLGQSYKLSVMSFGDMSWDATVSNRTAMMPWLGVLPNVGATVVVSAPSSWANIANGMVASTIANTVSIGNTKCALGDAVTVSCTTALPAGVFLTAAVTGANQVTVSALNQSGATLTIAGSLNITVCPRN